MEYLPSGFDNFFTGITNVKIYNTQLKEIKKENLKQFKDLYRLSITYNDLTSVDHDLFEHNPNIHLVDLSYNKIQFVIYEMKVKFGENYMTGNCVNNNALCQTNDRFDVKLKEFYTKWHMDKYDRKLMARFDEIWKEFEKINDQIPTDDVTRNFNSEIKNQITEDQIKELLSNCNCNSVKVSTLINVIIIVMITLAFIMLFIFKRSQKNSKLEQNVIEITNDNYKHRQLNVKKKCEIEVRDYETPLPIEEHIYDELHL
jgi:hypothetical protein